MASAGGCGHRLRLLSRRRPTSRFLCRWLLAALLGAASAASWAKEPAGTYSLLVENDVFTGTDRNYTNGLRFSYLSAKNDVSPLVANFAAAMPWIPRDASIRAGYAIGHSIFTPENTLTTLPLPDQRPYAGYLYGGIAVVAERNERELYTWELDLGLIGPSAKGEWVQNHFHRLIGVDEALGWHNQLRDEPTIDLIYERKWRNHWKLRRPGLGFDLTPHLGGSLGNVAVYLNGGATLRFGDDLQSDYGPPRIRPSLPGSNFFVPKDNFSWYLFAGVDGRLVAHNIFLDGNTFQDSLSVDRKPVVGDVQTGLVVNVFKQVQLSYTHVWRSPEFRNQDYVDQFGAFSLSVRY